MMEYDDAHSASFTNFLFPQNNDIFYNSIIKNCVTDNSRKRGKTTQCASARWQIY